MAWRSTRRCSTNATKFFFPTQVRGDPEKLLEQVGPGLVFSVEGVVSRKDEPKGRRATKK